MTYYYETQELARAAAVQYEPHWRTQVTNEPYNGWVITLYPATTEVLKYPLYDLLDRVELDLGRMWRRPATYVKPPPLENKKRPAPPPAKAPAPAPPPPQNSVASRKPSQMIQPPPPPPPLPRV